MSLESWDDQHNVKNSTTTLTIFLWSIPWIWTLCFHSRKTLKKPKTGSQMIFRVTRRPCYNSTNRPNRAIQQKCSNFWTDAQSGNLWLNHIFANTQLNWMLQITCSNIKIQNCMHICKNVNNAHTKITTLEKNLEINQH